MSMIKDSGKSIIVSDATFFGPSSTLANQWNLLVPRYGSSSTLGQEGQADPRA